MKRLFASLLASLVLVACQDPASPPSPGGSADAGGVSFRLQSLEASVLGTTSDSIKVEAERAGYPTVSGTAALHGSVEIGGLQSGVWTIRVAAFDSSHAIQWYGDTLAEIRAGSTSDVTVRLRRATGTAVVRIVLDSSVAPEDTLPDDTVRIDTVIFLPVHDTLWPVADTTPIAAGSYHLLGAEIAGNQVFIRTMFDCNNSPELRRWQDTAGTIHLVLGTRKPSTKMACIAEAREQVVGHLFTPGQAIVVEDLYGKVVRLPRTVIEPLPPRFATLEWEEGGGFTAGASSYRLTLDSTGVLVVFHTRTVWTVPVTAHDSMLVDPAPVVLTDTARRTLPTAELQGVKDSLASFNMAFPDTLPEPVYACADAGWWSAKVGYAGGHVAKYWKPEEICSDLPSNYLSLNQLAWRLVERVADPPILPIVD